MGVSNGADIMIDQIKYYYIFQKKLELILKGGINYFFNIDKEYNEIEKIYIIDNNWIKQWKNMSGYDIAKDSFDKLEIKNENTLLALIDKKCQELKKIGVIKKISLSFKNNKRAFYNFISKNMIDLEEFESLVDKKTYDLFKKIIPYEWFNNFYKTFDIQGIITDKMINLIIEKHYSIKILYYGLLENENKFIILLDLKLNYILFNIIKKLYIKKWEMKIKKKEKKALKYIYPLHQR